MEPIIDISHVSKSYGQVRALIDICLSIQKGDFFGLLGPNGAGKSTLINILCSLIMKDRGTINVCSSDLDQDRLGVKKAIGVVPQEFNFNFFETCEQIVCYQAGYYGISYPQALQRCKTLFTQLELSDKAHTQAMRLSGGMKRRLMIARALVHQPKVLILDEPTAGVDIAIRRSMWQLLRELNRQGMTIILTTHYLEEAETLCQRLAFINHGQIIREGKTADLLEGLNCERIEFSCSQTETLPDEPAFGIVKESSQRLSVSVCPKQNFSQIIRYLDEYGIDVTKMKTKHSRLEELFIQIIEES